MAEGEGGEWVVSAGSGQRLEAEAVLAGEGVA
jgi:hypothetical protein